MLTATEPLEYLKHLDFKIHWGLCSSFPTSYIIKLINVSLAFVVWSCFCAEVTLQGRFATRHDHITIGCGFPRSKGANLSKARTGIFSCLNLKRSSAKLVLPKEMEMEGKSNFYINSDVHPFQGSFRNIITIKATFFPLKTIPQR